MDILDTTSHANAIITDLVKIAEKKGAAEGSTPKTIAAGINLITNTLSGNEEAKSPVIVRALDELVNAVDSGDGGSSDFSIAHVTITNNSSEEILFYIPVYDGSGIPGIQSSMLTDSEVPTFEGEVVIPTNGQLYVGSSLAQFTTGNTSVTGNATVENGSLIITGDCTITISDGEK